MDPYGLQGRLAGVVVSSIHRLQWVELDRSHHHPTTRRRDLVVLLDAHRGELAVVQDRRQDGSVEDRRAGPAGVGEADGGSSGPVTFWRLSLGLSWRCGGSSGPAADMVNRSVWDVVQESCRLLGGLARHRHYLHTLVYNKRDCAVYSWLILLLGFCDPRPKQRLGVVALDH
ncbi:hypothetical protein KCU94_g96, partial [Aureobasidium melanogenum]